MMSGEPYVSDEIQILFSARQGARGFPLHISILTLQCEWYFYNRDSQVIYGTHYFFLEFYILGDLGFKPKSLTHKWGREGGRGIWPNF